VEPHLDQSGAGGVKLGLRFDTREDIPLHGLDGTGVAGFELRISVEHGGENRLGK